jgi:outer membrane immunogenic protein
VGVAGQRVGTGWVTFARFDYRSGDRLEGWDLTGGVRYHFTPPAAIPVIGKAPMKAPPMVVAHNWTGFYIGASAGAAFAEDEMDVGGVASPNPKGGGFIGGGQIGYNRQFAPQWVGGIELAGNWTNLNGAKECTNFPTPALGSAGFGVPVALQNTTCNFDSDWLATLTGRLGYVWGRALWYVKAGGAATREAIAITCNNVTPGLSTTPCQNALNGTAPASASGEKNRYGWTIGYGVEFALTDRWSAGAETSYHSFGDRSLTLTDGTVVKSEYDILTTMIRVNYKLR